jgi:hemolysin activation/secretion protein
MARGLFPTLLFWCGCLGCVWAATAPSLASVPQGRAPVPIDIEEYTIDGNSVLPTEDVERAVYPYLGPESNDASIEQARLALQKLYRDRGYRAVQVFSLDKTPDADGVIHFRVAEVRIGRVRVVGARFFLPSEIRKEMPSVREGAQFNTVALEKDLQVANSLPGREVTPVPKPSRRPGMINLDLVVHDQLPVHASVEVNNDHARFSTPLRVTGSFSYSNLFQRGQTLSASYIASPENRNDTKVLILGYAIPFIGTPFGVRISAIQSNSKTVTVSSTSIISNGTDVAVRGTAELPGTDTYSQSVEAGVDYKDYRADTNTGGAVTPVPVTYFPFTVSYTGIEQGSSNLDIISLLLSLTPPRVGSNREVIDANRFNSRGQQLYFRAGVDATEDVWAGFKLHARVNTQVSNEPLISNEQLALGGAGTVRGYYSVEAPVDNGYNVSAEVITPSFPDLFANWFDTRDFVQELRVLGFFDQGGGYNRAPLPGVSSRSVLASTGLSADAKLANHMDASLTWAMPLITDATDPRATVAGTNEILFSVLTEY